MKNKAKTIGCCCGCGKLPKAGRSFVQGHALRGRSFWKGKKRPDFTKEHRRKISASNLGKPKGPQSEEHKRRLSESKIGHGVSDETRRKQSESMKKVFADPVWKDRWVRNTREKMKLKPNKSEAVLLQILEKFQPGDWKYVGDGSFIIAGKNPDFINVNGKKLIIELFGDYWHKGEDPADRAKLFEPYGFKTLVIWHSELSDLGEVVKKVEEFAR